MPDLTAWAVDLVAGFVGGHGLWALGLLMALESMCIPVPSEVVMLFGGFLAGTGELRFAAVVGVGLVANVAGACASYALGRSKGRAWLLRARWLHVGEDRLDTVTGWFDRHGAWAVLVARSVPVVRAFISLPAGMAGMPFGRFVLVTTLGSTPWVLGFAAAGWAAGENWEAVSDWLHVVDWLLLAALVAGAVWLVVRVRRAARDHGDDPDRQGARGR